MRQIQSIQIGQHHISYEQHGKGPPLLLVHGLAASTLWWSSNIAAFSQHYTVYCVDLVGFGRSRAAAPLTIEQAADLLAELIVAWGYQQVDIVAHSLGGFICMVLAARHPQRVGRMVLAAAAGGRAMRAAMPEMMLRALISGLVCRPKFVPIVFWDTLRAGLPVLWKASTNLMHWDITPLYQDIRAPILFIWGDRDILVPLHLGLQHHAALKQSQFRIIDDAGHVVMNDQALVFNQLSLAFLQSETQASS